VSYVTPPTTSIAALGIPLSPDASPVVSLTLYDATASDLYAEAISLAQTLFPDWNPVVGNTEVALLQSLSTIVAEEIFAINRLPLTVVQSLLLLAGVTPSAGSQATATAVFTLTDNTNGVTVLPGTTVQLQMSEGRIFTFATQQSMYLPPGTLVSPPIPIICTSYSATPNGTAAGTGLSLPTIGVLSVASIVLGSEVLGGADPESVQSWVNRGTQVLQRLSSTLITPSQFQQAALSSDPTVWRCQVTNNWDPTLDGGNGASALGNLTVSVYGKSNPLNPGSPSPVAADHKLALANLLNAQAQANLSVHVVDATVTAASVVAVVTRLANSDAASVELAVQQAVFGWMSSDTWMWDGAIRYMKLLDAIENAAGVDYASYVTLNGVSGDLELAGIAALANAAVVTVTVNDPAAAPSTTFTVNISGTYTGAATNAAVNAAVTTWATAAIASGTLLYTELVATVAQVAGVTTVTGATINGQIGDLTVIPSATVLGAVTFT
jgi:hypothetical protein